VTDAAPIIDPSLPPEIAEWMESAGFSPRVETLMKIITDYRRLQAEARAKAERVTEAEEVWPLKGLVPIGVEYEQARRAAERGLLVAEKIGGRWFCTKPMMARWVAATGRCRRR
jgi:hypothetical protein